MIVQRFCQQQNIDHFKHLLTRTPFSLVTRVPKILTAFYIRCLPRKQIYKDCFFLPTQTIKHISCHAYIPLFPQHLIKLKFFYHTQYVEIRFKEKHLNEAHNSDEHMFFTVQIRIFRQICQKFLIHTVQKHLTQEICQESNIFNIDSTSFIFQTFVTRLNYVIFPGDSSLLCVRACKEFQETNIFL